MQKLVSLEARITLEEIGKKILCGFTSSSQLIHCDLDKDIELIHVTFHFLQLSRERREVFTKDPGGCLGVNVGFTNEDLD